jgi:hypothetical protein
MKMVFERAEAQRLVAYGVCGFLLLVGLALVIAAAKIPEAVVLCPLLYLERHRRFIGQRSSQQQCA